MRTKQRADEYKYMGDNMRMRIGGRMYFSDSSRRRFWRGVIFAVFAFVLIYTALGFFTRLRPMMKSVSQSYATNLVRININKIVAQKMLTDGARYSDLANIQESADGRVMSLSANVVALNVLKSELEGEITKSIAQMDTLHASLPLGNLLGNDLFSGLGPRIPMKFTLLSNAVTSLSDEFISGGINQTLHIINLNVETRVTVLMPTLNSVVKVTTDIPIAQTLIVGEVPTTYTSVTGTTETAPDTVLNMMP
ncbi:MAG: sporulation protein YunB [Clostridia bacterium]|nr:sporulation protein YunB [Clostridia bacterium]